jgi:hypothetical protein
VQDPPTWIFAYMLVACGTSVAVSLTLGRHTRYHLGVITYIVLMVLGLAYWGLA